MKNYSILFLLTIFPFGILISQDSESITNSKDLAWNIINHDIYNFDKYWPTQPYVEGKLKIISGKENSIVVAIDEKNNGQWGKFIGIQTSKTFNLNEDISNGEIIYTPSLVIVNSKDDERRFILKLDNDESHESENKIPEVELEKVQQSLVGYSIHVHKGNQYTVDEFIDYK